MKSKNKVADECRQYHNVCKLVSDVAKAMINNQSVADCPQVIRFLRNNKFTEEMIAHLSSADYHHRAYNSAKHYNKEKRVHRLLNRIDEIEHTAQHYRKRRRLWFISISATAAAVAFIVILFSYVRVNKKSGYVAESQVSLTFPDGRSVSLNNTNDTFMEEAEAFIKNAEGTLTIERKEEGTVHNQPTDYCTLNVAQGYQYDIILEDNTHVWLNSGSSLRFPPVFQTGERRVFAEGEVYFEVAKDAARPFIVETQEQTLTVLGTSFNIYAYPNEPAIYTTLLSGSVIVKSASDEIMLTPDHYCQLNRNNGELSIKAIDATSVAMWRDGNMFVFDDNTLEQVLMKISRWYNVEVAYNESDARALVYRGNLPKYKDIKEMLKSIETASSVKFTKQNNKYIMTKEIRGRI